MCIKWRYNIAKLLSAQKTETVEESSTFYWKCLCSFRTNIPDKGMTLYLPASSLIARCCFTGMPYWPTEKGVAELRQPLSYNYFTGSDIIKSNAATFIVNLDGHFLAIEFVNCYLLGISSRTCYWSFNRNTNTYQQLGADIYTDISIL